jgi:hypothetical protein
MGPCGPYDGWYERLRCVRASCEIRHLGIFVQLGSKTRLDWKGCRSGAQAAREEKRLAGVLLICVSQTPPAFSRIRLHRHPLPSSQNPFVFARSRLHYIATLLLTSPSFTGQHSHCLSMPLTDSEQAPGTLRPPRRVHKKSRKGCADCKARRVKVLQTRTIPGCMRDLAYMQR